MYVVENNQRLLSKRKLIIINVSATTKVFCTLYIYIKKSISKFIRHLKIWENHKYLQTGET